VTEHRGRTATLGRAGVFGDAGRGDGDPAERREQFLNSERSRRILVAIPAYNEERFIGSVVVAARLIGLSVLVIDDGSTDRTAEVAEGAGAIVERHLENRGKAAALNTAFNFARTWGAEALVVLDGDGQHSIAEVEPFLEALYRGETDVVIGSRFLSASAGEVPRVRQVGQRAMTLVTNLGSGTSVTDSQSGFRAFSRRAIDVVQFRSAGFSAEVEMQFWAREHGLRLVEVPITANYFDPPKRNVVSHGLQVLNGVLWLISHYRPLLFFGVPGLALLLVGLGFGLTVVSIYDRTQVLAVGYALMTLLCTIAGMLCLTTGVVLHSMRRIVLGLEMRIASIDVTPYLRGLDVR
jgi:glycosyltransferase involved in cell wall biosynthesis